MSAEPRCRSCLHLWRWHHLMPTWPPTGRLRGMGDLPGPCSRCDCQIWGQPPGGDPRYTSRVTRRQAIAEAVAEVNEAQHRVDELVAEGARHGIVAGPEAHD